MSKRSKRRMESKLKRALLVEEQGSPAGDAGEERPTEQKSTGWRAIYEGQYKKLLLIPFIILLAALLQIGYQQITTGDFISKDVTLKGGITVTIPSDQAFDLDALTADLSVTFPGASFDLREMSTFGSPIGIIVNADIGEGDREQLISFLVEKVQVERGDISIEEIGSSLGAQFFRQTLLAILIAFVFMGTVVFLYFKDEMTHFKGLSKLKGLVPSGAVILSAFSDMVVTLAIVNLLGVKVSTAGIAAFLMLIGYSVDTDILLTIRVLKNKEGTEMERIYSAIKTGLTMNFTTLAAVSVAFLLSESEVLKQIMMILFIGLLADMINTWIQNVGIIRWYLEKRHHV